MSRAEREKWERTYTVESAPERASGPPAAVLAWAPRAARPGALALDLGCGLLRNAGAVLEKGYRLVGIDVSRTALRRGRRSDVFTFRADLDRYRPPESTFDLIVAVHYLNRAAAPDVARALRPGGALLVEARLDDTSEPFATKPAFRLTAGEAIELWRPLVVRRAAELGGIARYLLMRPHGRESRS